MTVTARDAVRRGFDALAPLLAVRHGHWIVGASGAQPWYDHAIATIAIALFEAAIEHERGNA